MAGSDQGQQGGLKALKAREEGWVSACVRHSDSLPLPQECHGSCLAARGTCSPCTSPSWLSAYLYMNKHPWHIYYVNTSERKCIHHYTHRNNPQ